MQPSTEAVNCTEVLSDRPFWYYSTELWFRIQGVRENLREAQQLPTHPGFRYRLLLAGTFADNQPFPLNLLDAERKQALDAAYDRHIQAEREARLAADAFHDVLRSDMLD